MKRGRPVNSDSERQKRLAERESKLANGGLKRGRPVDANSERQKRLAARVTKSDIASLNNAPANVTATPIVYAEPRVRTHTSGNAA